MTDSQYRLRLQQLAEFLVATLPSTWHEAAVRARFPSDVRTDLEVWYRPSPSAKETWVDFPDAMMRDFVGAARAVRSELERAGNPQCKGFVFHLTKDGQSSLDVEY